VIESPTPSSSREAGRERSVLGLTRREREVLELVAEGLTNAQIAGRLWISCKTVGHHLESTYAKLGVHTRTAAVRVAGS
jgi:DNA-binding CsgD family transcriptional regulator